MAIDATSAVGTSKTSATAKKNDNSPEAIQERFMSLLVAQLKNQDPMAPMDNAQVTSQMAQLNTVTGINKLNDSMSAMVASFASNQTAQAVTMLGRAVLTEGNDIAMKDGVGTGSLEMKQSADSVQVNILDSNAKVIRTMDMGPQSKGIHQFDWDGKDANGNTVPSGNYKFEVQATAAGQKADVTTLSLAVVQGVRNAGSEGSKLLTNLGTELSFSDIKQIF
ncbi:flagellar hook assembly protein FlgD [Limnobacter humi]|uniref:Basal-body rod modification protein FlgD n=1 Tax=Limnobacter humi TaxID=1778671 RepID=A0ABT1WIM7_9BURK|nr:flagellar hook assembly protein FlgD [Limnobacter humi]MCQ8897365.1 flagellar hook assembly protein FlgD [Limnobacter humi]